MAIRYLILSIYGLKKSWPLSWGMASPWSIWLPNSWCIVPMNGATWWVHGDLLDPVSWQPWSGLRRLIHFLLTMSVVSASTVSSSPMVPMVLDLICLIRTVQTVATSSAKTAKTFRLRLSLVLMGTRYPISIWTSQGKTSRVPTWMSGISLGKNTPSGQERLVLWLPRRPMALSRAMSEIMASTTEMQRWNA